MRRFLLVTAVAVPAIVLAAVPADSGQVVEVNNFNAEVTSSYVNLEHCAGSPLQLEWVIVAKSTTERFLAEDSYKIYSTNTTPAVDTTTGLTLCPEADSTGGTGPDVFAKQVDAKPATRATETLAVAATTASSTVNMAGVVDAAHLTCDAASETKVLYVCAHWTDAADAKKGAARGTFIIQVKRPNAPASVTTTPGDGALNVSWPAATTDGGAAQARSYRVIVKRAGAEVKRENDLTATSVRVSGLENDVTYDVEVFGLSVAKNQSASPALGTGTPKPVSDFWDIYQGEGGQEQGGCGAGGAGPFALLGVAGLLAALRRRK